MKHKEQKINAIIELKDRSVIDKKEKKRTKMLAERLASQADLDQIFKDEPSSKKL